MARGPFRVFGLLCILGLASGAWAQTLPTASTAVRGPYLASNPALQASLARIARSSALWRDAADSISKVNRRVVVVTSEQVVVADGDGRPPRDAFDASVLAEAAPIPRADGRVDTVLIVVNLALLEQQHREAHLPPVELERDLDRILAHELYGNAVPYLLAGHLSGRCADPLRGERAVDACSIKRENAVRAELGLGSRVDYGVDDLSLSRRPRF